MSEETLECYIHRELGYKMEVVIVGYHDSIWITSGAICPYRMIILSTLQGAIICIPVYISFAHLLRYLELHFLLISIHHTSDLHW